MTWGERINQLKAEEGIMYYPPRERQKQICKLTERIYKQITTPGFEQLRDYEINRQLFEIGDSFNGGIITETPKNLKEYQAFIGEQLQLIYKEKGEPEVERLIDSGEIPPILAACGLSFKREIIAMKEDGGCGENTSCSGQPYISETLITLNVFSDGKQIILESTGINPEINTILDTTQNTYKKNKKGIETALKQFCLSIIKIDNDVIEYKRKNQK